ADFEGTQLCNIHHLMLLDGIRHAPLQTRRHRLVVFAETRNNSDLAFLHDHEAAQTPDHDNDYRQTAEQFGRARRQRRHAATRATGTRAARPAAATLVAKQRANSVVEVAPDLIQIGRTFVVPWTLR